MLNITLNLTTEKKDKPDESSLGFGTYFTDHMFIMNYEEGKGWFNPRIVPYAPISLDPSAMVFHYAQESFEGLKAYRTPNNEIQLFRPDKNAERMCTTHKRMCIPEVPVEDFIQACKELVKVEEDWVPQKEGTSLYLRPFAIATEAQLGVKASSKYLFMIIASPVGDYYPEGINPIKIYVENDYVRAAPGGTGSIKCGGNYAASLAAQEKADALGYTQVLWLDGVEKKYVEEVGSMNCFFKIDGKIYTAPTGVTVLPGVTRASVIEVLKKWGYEVIEDKIAIADIMKAHKEGRLEEVFGTGTAAVISPVGELHYDGNSAVVNDFKIGELTKRLYDKITDTQWGRVEDDMNWIVNVK